MKILVFSDSHGYLENMKQVINHFSDINVIIHLGDFIDDTKDLFDIYPHLKIYAVSGNNDYKREPRERAFCIQGYKFFITHGDEYSVYFGVDKLAYRGLEEQANFILFGHTHKMFLEQSEYVILNPGSISYPRDGNIPTFSIINLEGENFDIQFFGVYIDKIEKIR